MPLFKLIGLVIGLLALAILGLSVKILFHRSHKFPETSAGHNRELRKKGVKCPKHEEIKCWGKSQKASGCHSCYGEARELG